MAQYTQEYLQRQKRTKEIARHMMNGVKAMFDGLGKASWETLPGRYKYPIMAIHEAIFYGIGTHISGVEGATAALIAGGIAGWYIEGALVASSGVVVVGGGIAASFSLTLPPVAIAATAIAAGLAMGYLAEFLYEPSEYIVKYVWEAMIDGWNNHVPTYAEIRQALESYVDYIGETSTKMYEGAMEAIKRAADKISDWANATQEAVEQFAKEAYDSFVEQLGKLSNWTRQTIDEMKAKWNGFDFEQAMKDAYEAMKEALHDMFGNDTPQATKPQTPIILDMDGDGLELINVNLSKAYFDIDNDGFREKMAWVAPDDAIIFKEKHYDSSMKIAFYPHFVVATRNNFC